MSYQEKSGFVNPDKELINLRHWEKSLLHQLPHKSIPDFTTLYSELSAFITSMLNHNDFHT